MSDKLALALFSKSPYSLAPWAADGFMCKNIDINANCGFNHGQFFEAIDLRNIDFLLDYIEEGGIKPSIILAFPPCDDLAVCGAKHFAGKRAKDPEFQDKAIKLFTVGERLAKIYKCPVLTENPRSCASTLYRKPDHRISPNEFGGYLPEDDEHPEWPEYIAPRDAYRKDTWYWTGGGMQMPDKKPVPLFDTGVETYLGKQGNSKQFLKLGGKSDKTKTIRSMTPRGVFIGLHQKMRDLV